MRFLLMMSDEPQSMTANATTNDVAAVVERWTADLQAQGRLGEGSRLADGGGATTVRIRGDQMLVTDGPFAESHEVITGFEVVDCASLDEAVAIAARHPAARGGRIDVRAFLGD